MHQWDVGGGGGGRGVCGSEVPLIAAREIGGCFTIDLQSKLITRIQKLIVNYHLLPSLYLPSSLSLSLSLKLTISPFSLPLPPPSKNLNRMHVLYKYSGGQGHVPGQDKARCMYMCMCMHTSVGGL